MNSIQRVQKTFRHEEPDRVPIFEIHIDARPAEEILGHSAPTGYAGAVQGLLRNKMIMANRLDEFYQNDIELRLELCRKLDLDIIRAFPYPKNPPVPKLIEENTWRVEAGGGTWSVFRYSAPSDAYIEIDSHIRQGGVEALEETVRQMEEQEPNLENISFAPIEYVKKDAPDLCILGWADVAFYHNSWMALLLEAMVGAPELVDRWMQVNARQIMLQLEEELKRGAHLILGGQDFCDTHGPMFSLGCYKRFVEPYLKDIVELCHRYGVPYLRHNDGQLGPLEKTFLLESGIDGWHAIEPGAGNNIHYFKRTYGERITLAGNIDCASTLIHGTPEEIESEVRDKIRGCAPGGGYIVASSNSIHGEVPGRNYLIMREAVEKHGYYPIT